MVRSFLALFVLLAFFSGCSVKTDVIIAAPHRSVGADRIQEETVSLVGETEEGKWQSYCAAVWIGERMLLTAFHCAIAMQIAHLPEPTRAFAEKVSPQINIIGSSVDYATKKSYSGVLYSGAVSHYSGKVIFTDSTHDLALIEAEDDAPAHRVAHLSDKHPIVGDAIEIMGHPGGVEFTYARGYVSGYRTDIEEKLLNIRGPFIQVNAGISGGNSGGGIFNTDGELVGVICFINNIVTNQGFAISIPPIRHVLLSYYAERDEKVRLTSR